MQYGGISKNAFYGWLALNPQFKARIELLRQMPTIAARISVCEAMEHDGNLALKYLERKSPDEFSLKANVRHSYEFTGITLDKPKPITASKETMPEIEIETLD